MLNPSISTPSRCGDFANPADMAVAASARLPVRAAPLRRQPGGAAQVMRQLITYFAIGGLAALLYLAVALGATCGLAIAPRWASLGGFVIALPFSYFGHQLFTFRSGGKHQDELPRFVVAASVGLLISASVPELAVHQWHAAPAIGYLAACIGVPALNYIVLRFWVFVGRRIPRDPTALDPARGKLR